MGEVKYAFFPLLANKCLKYIFQDYFTWNSGREESAFSTLLHIVLYYCAPRFPPMLTVLYRKRSIVEREGRVRKRMEFLAFQGSYSRMIYSVRSTVLLR